MKQKQKLMNLNLSKINLKHTNWAFKIQIVKIIDTHNI